MNLLLGVFTENGQRGEQLVQVQDNITKQQIQSLFLQIFGIPYSADFCYYCDNFKPEPHFILDSDKYKEIEESSLEIKN